MISILLILGLAVQLELGASRIVEQEGFPEKKYVKPGGRFKLDCVIEEEGFVEVIYNPRQDKKSDSYHVKQSRAKTDDAFIHYTSKSSKEFTDVTKEEHAGFYTCVIYLREEPYIENVVCEVIIEDLCEDVQCPEPKTCVDHYENGTTSCNCVFDCPLGLGLDLKKYICTDHCETLSHECEMKEKNCQDGGDRKVWKSGLCPFTFEEHKKPELDKITRTINVYPKVGEKVSLSSGLQKDGVPSVGITWSQDSVVLSGLNDQADYTFTAAYGMKTYIECEIHQCSRNAYVRRYYIETEEEEIYPVCSVYPGGAVEQFNSQSVYYDLACTHILAADYGPGGDYTKSWFIYGTFDQHDGNTALMSMTIYIGSTAFQFQRGWIINIGGEKLLMEEGVQQSLGDCKVIFTGLHLRAACPYFYAYFDGIMSGHIRLGNSETSPSKAESVKSATNIGLCWDNESGFRPNWQMESTDDCKIQPDKEGCEDSGACNRFVLAPFNDPELEWANRGLGAHQACNELTCEGSTPSPEQECALNQANQVNLHLRVEKQLTDAVVVDECPEDECTWKREVEKVGCPQDQPPFVCV